MTPTTTTTTAPATGHWGSYAIGVLADVRVGPEIVRYIEQIDATLAPFGGSFLVHGGAWDQVEGTAAGDPVVIGFPDADGAARWYRSPGYRAIVGWRSANSVSRVWLAEGVDVTHRSTDVLPAMLATVDTPAGA